MKGKIACEISAANELIITEMLFSGILDNLTSEEIASLCSCLVLTDFNGDAKEPTEKKLLEGFSHLKEIITKVGNIMIESKIELKLDEFVDKFKPNLMEVTLEWCRG